MASLNVTLTPEARHALDERSEPLEVELELLFSCLVRKQLRFRAAGPGALPLESGEPKLKVHFRPVASRACTVAETGGAAPPLEDFPIHHPEAFTPRWLRLDYRGRQFLGEFGWR